MTDAVNVFPPGLRLVDADGVPISGATIEFYDAGTTDPRAVYSDSGLATSIGSTVTTDSAGYPTSDAGTTKTLVYTGSAAYKVIIKDGNGATLATHDDIVGAVVSGTGGGTDGITEAEADARYIRNPTSLFAISNIATDDIFGLWDTSRSANSGVTWANLSADLLSEWKTAGNVFATGVRMPFQQTTPPTGWTKETATAYEDAVAAFTTGTVATSGSNALSTVLKSWTFTGTVGNDTPSTAKTAAHAHDMLTGIAAGISTVSVSRADVSTGFNVASSSTGGGTAHNHSLTMNAADFTAKTVELSIGVKT